MIVLGVTGGIASGKSTVARMLCAPGDMHVNADALVHQLFSRDRAVIAALANAFPKAVKNNVASRKALGELVANNADALDRLEAIVHPAVRAAQHRAIAVAARQRRKLVVLDVPLMFESGADALCDAVITVQSSPALQKHRAFKRKGMTAEKFNALIARQLSDAERAAHADMVIYTNRGKAHTRAAVQKLRAALFS